MEPYSQTIERMLSTAQYVSVQRPPGWQDQLSLTLAAKTNQDWVALTQNMVKLAYDNEFVAPIYFQQVPSIKQNNVYGDGITSENYSQFFWTPSTAWISK
jgi:hypothetical protein